ncbi:MAG: Na+/citrate or Na+/malate symporter [Paraglaciecola sp.]|jgi:Na+/citrate or Na+/malate symporter
MEKQNKSIYLPLFLWQIALIVSWYLGQNGMVTPLAQGSLMLFFTGGIFYTITQKIPKARTLFLTAFLLIFLLIVWLFILPSLK